MSGNSRPTAEERETLSKSDWRDEEEIIVTRPLGAANSGYAYHEPTADMTPLCNAGGVDDEFIEMTVGRAQRRNKSPCKMCDRILRQHGDSM